MSNQHSGQADQFPNRYRHDRLLELMKATGNTPATTAVKADKSKTTVAEALVGECKKMTTLWDITMALTDNESLWEYLFKFDSDESRFLRAVRQG